MNKLFWKYLKFYVEAEGITSLYINGSPREVVKTCSRNKIISPEEANLLLQALADRNLTSHTYVEKIAHNIALAVPNHYAVMKKIADRLKP